MKKFVPLLLWILLGSLNLAQIPVPDNGCYLSAFTPWNGQTDFENLSGRKIAIEMNYKQWSSTASFPQEECDGMLDNESIPHITWEPWNTDASSSAYSNDKIINGSFDTYITTWAQQIKDWGHPLFIRWGHEMNGNWYPWDGAHSGGATLTGFGDPEKPDGPEKYVAAYRHIHDIFENVGADNVAWIWCPMNSSTPNESWNAPENYYPGDEYVDWIGFDGYNWGETESWSSWTSFYNLFNPAYIKFSGYGKPMMIAEYASTEIGGNKAQWISDAYLYLRGYFKKIKAVTWFQINKETDWRINSSDASLQAFKTAISNTYFLEGIPSIAVEEDEQPVYTFKLGNSYPNPFNGAVRIPFSIKKEGVYRLEIWNALGELVQIVFNKSYSPGEYEAHWNFSGSGAAATGVYFIKLSSESSIQTSKIMLLK